MATRDKPQIWVEPEVKEKLRRAKGIREDGTRETFSEALDRIIDGYNKAIIRYGKK